MSRSKQINVEAINGLRSPRTSICGIVAAIAERSVQSILIEDSSDSSIADMILQVALVPAN